MSPALRPGDWVIVTPARRVHFGDVAVFRYGRRIVVHRVVGRARQMGDANGRATRFRPEHIVGRAVLLVRDDVSTYLTAPTRRVVGKVLALRSLWRWMLASLSSRWGGASQLRVIDQGGPS
jgi:signal peptidase I